MKKIYLTLVCLMALTATSCNDFLDVHPKGEKVEGDLFEDAQGFEDAIYGVYGYMGVRALYGMDMVWGIPELLDQNLVCTSTYGNDFGKYDYTTNAETRNKILGIWKNAYEAIGYANNVLKNLENNNQDALPLYNLYKGEMLGVRAMLHFDLLRLFAPTDQSKRGIPYVTAYSFSVKPFSTVGECYQFIVNDLTEAERLMADEETMSYPRDNDQYEAFNRWRENHINLYAVKALLARVHWYFGNKAKAAEYAEEVINSGRFPFVDVTEIQEHVAGVLCPKETIFGLYSTQYLEFSTDFLFNYQFYKTYTAYDDSSGSVHPMPWHKLFNEVDVDATMQDYRKGHFRQAKGYTTCLKLVDYVTNDNDQTGIGRRESLIHGIHIIGISEMYLIAADALLESNYQKAVGYFNDEISARGLTKLREGDVLTANRIFNEYHKELYGEGQHWFNMKRINADIISNNESMTIPGSDAIYVLPIPQEEFDYRPEDNK